MNLYTMSEEGEKQRKKSKFMKIRKKLKKKGEQG